MRCFDELPQSLDAAVVERRVAVEKPETAGGFDVGLDGAQTVLEPPLGVTKSHIEHGLRLGGGKTPPDRVAGGDGQGQVKHEPGLADDRLASDQQEAIDDGTRGGKLPGHHRAGAVPLPEGGRSPIVCRATRPLQFLPQPRRNFLSR